MQLIPGLQLIIVFGLLYLGLAAAEQREFTNSWAIELEDDISPQMFADRHGFSSFMKIAALHNTFIFRKELVQNKRSSSSLEFAEWAALNSQLASDNQVIRSHHQEALVRKKRSLSFADPMWNMQWNLNANTTSVHLNVLPAWRRDVNGAGVLVAIVDDGMQADHPDLVDQFSTEVSWNVVNDNGDVTPGPYDQDGHGTKCGGTATARNNSVCGVGVAYRANVAAVKVIDSRRSSTDAEEAAALGHRLDLVHIYSASWGPSDDAQRLEGPGLLLREVMQNAIAQGRGGLGAIYVWANGNGGSARDNCNYDGYANSRFTISVQATLQDGTKPYYTELCAATLVSAPGGANRGYDDIVAPNLGSHCTSGFAETSACAPQGAGVVAMILQVNPMLNWREVQDILLRTTQKNDPKSGGWALNGAQRHVHHAYGYGLMDADAASRLAAAYDTGRHRLPYLEVGKESAVNRVISGANPAVATILLPDLIVEHVVVRLWVRTSTRGDLGVVLKSPMGTESQLATQHTNLFAGDSSNYEGWNFTSVRHWDERAQGDWMLTITDFGGTGGSTFVKWALYAYGTDAEADSGNGTFPPIPTAPPTTSPTESALPISSQRLVFVAVVTGIVIIVVILTIVYLVVVLRKGNRGAQAEMSSLPLDADWDAEDRGEDSSHALQRVLGTGPSLQDDHDTQGLLNDDGNDKL